MKNKICFVFNCDEFRNGEIFKNLWFKVFADTDKSYEFGDLLQKHVDELNGCSLTWKRKEDKRIYYRIVDGNNPNHYSYNFNIERIYFTTEEKALEEQEVLRNIL